MAPPPRRPPPPSVLPSLEDTADEDLQPTVVHTGGPMPWMAEARKAPAAPGRAAPQPQRPAPLPQLSAPQPQRSAPQPQFSLLPPRPASAPAAFPTLEPPLALPPPRPTAAKAGGGSMALLAIVVVLGLATGAALRFAYALYFARTPVAVAAPSQTGR